MKSTSLSDNELSSPVFKHAYSAATAWLVTSVVTNPLWVVKVRMQAQRYTSNPWRKYDGLLRSFQVIWKEEGIYGLYRGTLAAMLGALGAMVQFPIYEAVKNSTSNNTCLDNAASVSSKWNDISPQLSRIALASGVSSLLSSMTVYPLEVIRSRIQVQDAQTRNSYRGIVDCISKMLRQEGVLAFYKVIPSNILYLSISSMVIV
jgi:hypothetical protein